ncbi:hypothetical protein HOR75_gp67 [Shewanella phage SppYZU05]|uniref:Uncharacterized protein n=1 Tax=Shewanella phage SppYZU05 TaxID=1970795 RepID=A0A1W6JTJ8_9CAUD|nr:hypothetical protein HOR75_gp67 [Shewanella phage SppYZU05]ARM70593.1 hypothetical protein SppYZU05_67 [Shewanella phage SppYZU05]
MLTLEEWISRFKQSLKFQRYNVYAPCDARRLASSPEGDPAVHVAMLKLIFTRYETETTTCTATNHDHATIYSPRALWRALQTVTITDPEPEPDPEPPVTGGA